MGEALATQERRLLAALSIEVSDDEVVRRLGGRRVCTKSGHVYHLDFDPPKHEGICDQDGSRLIQRDDDHEETIRKRLQVYHAQTAPLIDYYEKEGLLRRFDGRRPPNEVHDHIRATLATLRLGGQAVVTSAASGGMDRERGFYNLAPGGHNLAPGGGEVF